MVRYVFADTRLHMLNERNCWLTKLYEFFCTSENIEISTTTQ